MTEKTIRELVTETGDVSDVVPSEQFADFIVEEASKGAKLEPAIAATQEDKSKGSGDSVEVPFFPTVSISDVNEGSAVAESDYSATTTSVTISRKGKAVPFTGESIWEAEYDLVQQCLNGLRRGYENKMDSDIATTLSIDGNAPSYTPKATATTGDYTGTPIEIYNAVDSLLTSLKESEIDPDALVISPKQEAALRGLMSDTNNNYEVTVDAGDVTGVFGLDTIVTNYASDYGATTTDDGLAAVLDTSVALAMGRGRDASFEEKDYPKKDQVHEIFNAYDGFGVIEDDIPEALGVGLIQHD